jgi:hypothetical protein
MIPEWYTMQTFLITLSGNALSLMALKTYKYEEQISESPRSELLNYILGPENTE